MDSELPISMLIRCAPTATPLDGGNEEHTAYYVLMSRSSMGPPTPSWTPDGVDMFSQLRPTMKEMKMPEREHHDRCTYTQT